MSAARPVRDLRTLGPKAVIVPSYGFVVSRESGPDGWPVYSLAGFSYGQVGALRSALARHGLYPELVKAIDDVLEAE